MTSQAPIPAPELPEEIHSAGLLFWKDKPPENFSDVFRTTVKNETKVEGDKKTTKKVATMRLYGPIYNGWMGISASVVATALKEIGDAEEIRVRINSPGGDVAEAMAILNMLRANGAKVVAVVDGIAASSGSFLAAGCEETVMSPGTQMMVHDASGICLGQSKDMVKMAQALDSFSNSIASVYAGVTGGTTEEWRAVMVEETWYTADEAVEAGLANDVRVVKDSGKTETPDAEGSEDIEDRVKARYDLSIFNYAGRDQAPPPHSPPSASAIGSVNTSERGSAVAFTAEQLTNMRQDLGLAEDADEATIVAALSEALSERADPVASPPVSASTPPPAADPAPAAPDQPSPGTMVIDSSAWEEREARIKRLEAQDAKRRRDERDGVIAQAVTDGKFAKARSEHWAKLWDASPEQTRTVIEGLTKNVVPVSELGHAGDDESIDDEFAGLFPPSYTPNGA
jgi:ATP-dependent protease ClpP protease subunit